MRQELLRLFVGIALIGPVGGEVGREDERAEMGEAHFLESAESGAKIGAAFERAAAAVDDEVGALWLSSGPGFDLRESIGAATAAVVLGALDVAGRVEALKADEENGGSGFGIGEFFEEIGGLDGLGGSPWIGGGGRGVKEEKRRNEEKGDEWDETNA